MIQAESVLDVGTTVGRDLQVPAGVVLIASGVRARR